MTFSKIFLFIVFTFTFHTVFSQNDTVDFNNLSLEAAKKYAVKNNYEIKNSKLDISIAKQKKWETTAMGLPQFNIDVDYQYVFDVAVMSLPISPTIVPDPSNPFQHMHIDTVATMELGTKSSTNINFMLTQLIFSGEYIVGLKAAKIYMQLSDKQYNLKEEEIKENVSKTYYLILVSEQSLSVLDSVLTNLKKLKNESSKISEAGFMENTDVRQIELNVKNTENSILSFKKQKDLLYQLLKFQSGININDTIVLTDKLSDILSVIDTENAGEETFNIENNKSYQLVGVQENLTELNLQREKSTYLPTVSAFYRHQEQINAPAFNFNPPDVVGIKINIPVFSSGMKHSKVQQRKIELEQVRNSKEQAAQGLYLEFQRTENDYITALRTFKNTKASKELAKQIYDNTLIKYKTGTESSLMLSQAHNQYFMTLSEYYRDLSNLLELRVKLNKLLNKI